MDKIPALANRFIDHGLATSGTNEEQSLDLLMELASSNGNLESFKKSVVKSALNRDEISPEDLEDKNLDEQFQFVLDEDFNEKEQKLIRVALDSFRSESGLQANKTFSEIELVIQSLLGQNPGVSNKISSRQAIDLFDTVFATGFWTSDKEVDPEIFTEFRDSLVDMLGSQDPKAVITGFMAKMNYLKSDSKETDPKKIKALFFSNLRERNFSPKQLRAVQHIIDSAEKQDTVAIKRLSLDKEAKDLVSLLEDGKDYQILQRLLELSSKESKELKAFNLHFAKHAQKQGLISDQDFISSQGAKALEIAIAQNLDDEEYHSRATALFSTDTAEVSKARGSLVFELFQERVMDKANVDGAMVQSLLSKLQSDEEKAQFKFLVQKHSEKEHDVYGVSFENNLHLSIGDEAIVAGTLNTLGNGNRKSRSIEQLLEKYKKLDAEELNSVIEKQANIFIEGSSEAKIKSLELMHHLNNEKPESNALFSFVLNVNKQALSKYPKLYDKTPSETLHYLIDNESGGDLYRRRAYTALFEGRSKLTTAEKDFGFSPAAFSARLGFAIAGGMTGAVVGAQLGTAGGPFALASVPVCSIACFMTGALAGGLSGEIVGQHIEAGQLHNNFDLVFAGISSAVPLGAVGLGATRVLSKEVLKEAMKLASKESIKGGVKTFTQASLKIAVKKVFGEEKLLKQVLLSAGKEIAGMTGEAQKIAWKQIGTLVTAEAAGGGVEDTIYQNFLSIIENHDHSLGQTATSALLAGFLTAGFAAGGIAAKKVAKARAKGKISKEITTNDVSNFEILSEADFVKAGGKKDARAMVATDGTRYFNLDLMRKEMAMIKAQASNKAEASLRIKEYIQAVNNHEFAHVSFGTLDAEVRQGITASMKDQGLLDRDLIQSNFGKILDPNMNDEDIANELIATVVETISSGADPSEMPLAKNASIAKTIDTLKENGLEIDDFAQTHNSQYVASRNFYKTRKIDYGDAEIVGREEFIALGGRSSDLVTLTEDSRILINMSTLQYQQDLHQMNEYHIGDGIHGNIQDHIDREIAYKLAYSGYNKLSTQQELAISKELKNSFEDAIFAPADLDHYLFDFWEADAENFADLGVTRGVVIPALANLHRLHTIKSRNGGELEAIRYLIQERPHSIGGIDDFDPKNLDFAFKVYDAIKKAGVDPESICGDMAVNYRSSLQNIINKSASDAPIEGLTLHDNPIETWVGMLDQKAAELGKNKAMLLIGESHIGLSYRDIELREHAKFLIDHMNELKARGITSIVIEKPHDRMLFSKYDATLDYHAFIDIEEELRSRIKDLNLKPNDDPALSKFLEELDAVSRQVDETYTLKSEKYSGKKNYEVLVTDSFDLVESAAMYHGLKTFRVDVDSHQHQKFLEVYKCLDLLNKAEKEFPDSQALKLIRKSLYEIKDRLMKDRDLVMALQLSLIVETQSEGHILGLFGSNHLRRERQGYYEFPSVTENLESWGQAVVTMSATNNFRDRSRAVIQPGFNLVDTLNDISYHPESSEVVITGESDELEGFDALFTRLNTVIEHD